MADSQSDNVGVRRMGWGERRSEQGNVEGRWGDGNVSRHLLLTAKICVSHTAARFRFGGFVAALLVILVAHVSGYFFLHDLTLPVEGRHGGFESVDEKWFQETNTRQYTDAGLATGSLCFAAEENVHEMGFEWTSKTNSTYGSNCVRFFAHDRMNSISRIHPGLQSLEGWGSEPTCSKAERKLQHQTNATLPPLAENLAISKTAPNEAFDGPSPDVCNPMAAGLHLLFCRIKDLAGCLQRFGLEDIFYKVSRPYPIAHGTFYSIPVKEVFPTGVSSSSTEAKSPVHDVFLHGIPTSDHPRTASFSTGVSSSSTRATNQVHDASLNGITKPPLMRPTTQQAPPSTSNHPDTPKQSKFTEPPAWSGSDISQFVFGAIGAFATVVGGLATVALWMENNAKKRGRESDGGDVELHDVNDGHDCEALHDTNEMDRSERSDGEVGYERGDTPDVCEMCDGDDRDGLAPAVVLRCVCGLDPATFHNVSTSRAGMHQWPPNESDTNRVSKHLTCVQVPGEMSLSNGVELRKIPRAETQWVVFSDLQEQIRLARDVVRERDELREQVMRQSASLLELQDKYIKLLEVR